MSLPTLQLFADQHGLSAEATAELETLWRQTLWQQTLRPQSPRPGSAVPEGATLLPDATTDAPPPEAARPGAPLPRGTAGSGTSGALRYQQLTLLGRGAMGDVWRVRDNELGRTLAMKIIQPDLLGRPEAVTRFIAEAQATAQLQHPAIVPVHELGRLPDGRLYFTMREVRGRRLSEAALAWPLRRRMAAFQTVCQAVGYAHERGVVHRDLKPDNIMVGAWGQVLVLDWGLVKLVVGAEDSEEHVRTSRASHTLVGTVAGTPAYMAPEQARGETNRIGPASDIYALGAILYELLAGHRAYGGASAAAVLDEVRAHEPRPLSELADPPPAALVEICERAMARQPADRYPTAGQLAAVVGRWLDGAERRERALAVLERGNAAAAEGDALRVEARRLRRAADTALERGSATGWESWEQAEDRLRRALQLELEQEQHLQGALVYEPELPAAHRALAALHRARHADAVTRGDRLGAEAAACRFHAHLQMLPRLEREASSLVPSHGEPLGRLVGRWEHRQALTEELRRGARLVTLVGPAGVGKTRLARDLLHRLDRPALFCDLTEARTPSGICGALARTLSGPLSARDDAGQLAGALAGRGVLVLVVDNVEQVASQGRPLLERWLAEAPGLQILATSRVRLGLDEEVTLPLGPLSILEGIELFVQRGQQARPDFSLTESNRHALTAVVERLDRLPLALELAAARLGMLSLTELGRRLDARFAILRSPRSAPRQRALQGALDWSWELLTPPQQIALAQCSVFRGGFDLPAAEAVLELPAGAPPTLDLLEALCDNHLLRRAAGARYALLESIRMYAGLRLAEHAFELQRRHAAHFGRLGATDALRSLKTVGGAERRLSLLAELENLTVAAQRVASDDGARCCLAALALFEFRGPLSAGIALAETVLSKESLSSERLSAQTRAELLLSSSVLLRLCDHNTAALEAATEALSLAEGHPAIVARAHRRLGILHKALGRIEVGRQHLELSRDGFCALGDQREEGISLNSLGLLWKERGQMARAQEILERSLMLLSAVGDRAGEANTLTALGSVYHLLGRSEDALRCYETALTIHREFDDHPSEGITLGNMGILLMKQDRLDEARACYTAALVIHRRVGVRRSEGIVLANLGILHNLQGDFMAARRHYRAALELYRVGGQRRPQAMVLANLGVLHADSGEIGTALEAYHGALEMFRELGDRRCEGMARGNMGALHLRQGDSEAAEAHLRAALEIHREVGNRYSQGTALMHMGRLHISTNRHETAESLLREALATMLEAGSPAEVAELRRMLKEVGQAQGRSSGEPA